MSSVSESKGAGDEAHRVREEYRKKEADLIKRQNQQIKQMQEKHTQTIEQMRADQVDQLKNYRQRINETLTRRDQKHTNEIEQLRRLHRQQLEAQKVQSEQQMQGVHRGHKAEKENLRASADRRVETAHQAYSRSLGEKSEEFSDQVNELRQQQQSAISSERERQLARHQGEVQEMQEAHAEQDFARKTEFDRYRESTGQTMKQKELRHLKDIERLSRSNMNAIRQEQQNRAEQEKYLREGFSQDLERVREDYEKQRAREDRAQKLVGDQYGQSVDERIDGQVARLEQKTLELKDQNNRDRAQNDQRLKNQVSNVERSYQKKVELLEAQNRDQHRLMKQENQRDVAAIRKETDNQQMAISRFYREKLDTESVRQREAFREAQSRHQLDNESLRMNTDERVRQVQENAVDHEVRLRDNFQAQLESVRDSNIDERNRLRENLEERRQQAILKIRERADRAEIEHVREMNQTIQKFNRRIAELNDQMTREKRRADEREKMLVGQMERQNNANLAAQKVQYEQRINEILSQQSKERDRQEQRHAAQLNAVVNKDLKS